MGYAHLWDKFFQKISESIKDGDLIWKLMSIYWIRVEHLKERVIWNQIPIPIKIHQKRYDWHYISDLSGFKVTKENDQITITTLEGKLVKFPKEVLKWGKDLGVYLYDIINVMCSIDLDEKNDPIFKPREPQFPEKIIFSRYIKFSDYECVSLVHYEGRSSDLFSIENPYSTVNINHPLAKLAYQSKYEENLSDLETFAHRIVISLCNPQLIENIMNKDEDLYSYFQYTGYLFEKLIEDGIDKKYQPPYKIWTRDRGFFELTANEILGWKNKERI